VPTILVAFSIAGGLVMTAVLERVRGPIFDFDYYKDPHVTKDAHEGYMRLKREAPPLFWTERNGGHWVVNNGDLAIEVLRQPEIFSSTKLSIPINPNLPRLIPQMIDPPEHRFYQKLLRPFFELRAVEPQAPRITRRAEEKIGAVADRGHCEFVSEVGSHFGLSVFMELVGFPLEQFDLFRELEYSFFSNATDRAEQARISQYILQQLDQLFEARRIDPKDDWLSSFVHAEFEGRKLTKPELLSLGFMMFLAGLDTVVNALAFGMRHLGQDPALQQRMIDDPDCIPAVVEELMRRYTFISLPRFVTEDIELGGITISKGDSILVPLASISWNCPQPDVVSIERAPCKHAAFGSGIHTCPGIHLARKEMAIFYKTWFDKIGPFRFIEAEEAMPMRIGTVQAVQEVHLAWG
jgi:cytochrome P450